MSTSNSSKPKSTSKLLLTAVVLHQQKQNKKKAAALHDDNNNEVAVAEVVPAPHVNNDDSDPFHSEIADACLDWVIFPSLLFIQFGATMYCQMKNIPTAVIDQSKEVTVSSTGGNSYHVANSNVIIDIIGSDDITATVTKYHIIDWKTVNMTVFAFCLVAGIYRQIMRRHNNHRSAGCWCFIPKCITNSLVWRLVLLLLPEIFTNILLAIVMVSTIEAAYTALVLLTLIMSFIGIVAGTDLLWNMEDDEEEIDEEAYQLLLDEDETAEEGAFVC